MDTQAQISVVIPSYNSARTIAMCLEGLRAQTLPPLEVIVVDSSNDDTAAIITAAFPEVRLAVQPQRTLAGRARNIGMELARGELVAFLDADAVAEPAWLERLVVALAGGNGDAVGGAIEIGNPASEVAWAGHLMESVPFFPQGAGRIGEHISSCSMIYKSEMFRVLGGFFDHLAGFEDNIFSANARQRGVRLWFEPASIVRHFLREDLSDFQGHMRGKGRTTFVGLRQSALPGSRICQNAALGLVAAPAIGAWKMARAIFFFIRQYPRAALTHPRVYALLALGIFWWTRGFAEGALEALRGARERHYSVQV